MDLEDGISLVVFAFEQEINDKLFTRWVQSAQNEMSFDDFKRALTPVPEKDEKDIINDVKNIFNSYTKEVI